MEYDPYSDGDGLGCTRVFIVAIIFWLLLILLCNAAHCGEAVNMEAIKQIESSGNSRAWNRSEDARGHYQIRNIVLREWNNYHKSRKFEPTDLWDPVINAEIAGWYMNKRIPQMLRYYKIEDNVKNRIISYNAGISTLTKRLPIPKITLSYLKKYRKRVDPNDGRS